MAFLFFLIYVLSFLRLPYALLPYLIKFILFSILRDSFLRVWNNFHVQIIRVFAEFINLFFTTYLFLFFFQSNFAILLLLKFAFIAESVRLVCEKGIMVWSASWQFLPHRRIAKFLSGKKVATIFHRYICYYILSDEKRITRSFSILKAKVKLLKKYKTKDHLQYVTAFRVVPDQIPLRLGKVRDVARGEIYIHVRWLNNLDLLHGLALRRSPWIFDPRYLHRPFYYRSEANPLMTRYVLENAVLCPVFALYQFGHEIKSARYEIFYKFFRWLRIELEQPICEDGSNQFEVLAKKLLRINEDDFCRPLWSDEEVVQDLQDKREVSTLEIAETYTYPCVYVNEVLIKKL